MPLWAPGTGLAAAVRLAAGRSGGRGGAGRLATGALAHGLRLDETRIGVAARGTALAVAARHLAWAGVRPGDRQRGFLAFAIAGARGGGGEAVGDCARDLHEGLVLANPD